MQEEFPESALSIEAFVARNLQKHGRPDEAIPFWLCVSEKAKQEYLSQFNILFQAWKKEEREAWHARKMRDIPRISADEFKLLLNSKGGGKYD